MSIKELDATTKEKTEQLKSLIVVLGRGDLTVLTALLHPRE